MIDPLMDLRGKTAIITGGARGIGAATAILLARHGADIAIFDLRKTEEAEKVVSAVREEGRRCRFVPVDVANYKAVQDTKEIVENELGAPDILINNAGIALSNTMVNIPEEDWDTVIDVNLKGVYNTCKTFVPGMMDRRYGRVINVSSIAGRRGSIFGDVHYSSAKAGVIGFTKCLARITGPQNVLCNAVAPGIVKTDILSAVHEQQSQANIPLGRTATATEIASVMLFLCAPMSSYVTGTVIDVNGGSYM